MVLDADGFAVAFIVVTQTAVDADVVCFCSHLYFPSRLSRFHTSCGVMAPQGISLYEHRSGESIAAQVCGKAGRMV